MKKEKEINLSEKEIKENSWSAPKILRGHEAVFFKSDVKEFIKKLKEEWEVKCRRMEVMSIEVAIWELKALADKLAGKNLI